mgnify:CR=1 FL=1
MSNTHLDPVFAHAFNAATLREVADENNNEQDIHIADMARVDFDAICNNIPNLDPQLRNKIATAIDNGSTDDIMLIAHTAGVEEHPVAKDIKAIEAEIIEQKNKLAELEAQRAVLMDQARAKDIPVYFLYKK